MQQTFSELEYAGKKKLTRRDRFLADLEQLVPWALLEAQVAPFYASTAGKWGRPAIGLSRMQRMYLVQQCFVGRLHSTLGGRLSCPEYRGQQLYGNLPDLRLTGHLAGQFQGIGQDDRQPARLLFRE